MRPNLTTRIYSLAAVLATAGFLLAPHGLARAQSYTIVDLGTLGGHASGADGLNEAGQAVGWSISDPYAYYGFVSMPGGPPLTNLGPMPNGTYSYAQEANDAGQVVGYGRVSVGFGTEDRAFLWENGGMTDLGTLGGDASRAWDINDAGQIVGWAEDGGVGIHAFLWENGVMTELPGFPGGYPDSEARGINETGVAVGYSWDAGSVRRPVVWESGVMTVVLDLVPGSTGAKAFAVNNVGQVVGNAWNPGNTTTAVLWDIGGGATILPRTRSHTYNEAYGINDRGQVVGTSYSGGHLAGSDGGPVLWEGGIAFELDDIVAPMPGTSLYGVYDINEAGQIAATGAAGGGFRALRLDPVEGGLGLTGPDPASVNQENRLAARGATPGERVYFVYGFAEGLSDVPGCPGAPVDIENARLIGYADADGAGHAVFSGVAPAALSGRTVFFQAVEHSSCRTTNVTTRYFF